MKDFPSLHIQDISSLLRQEYFKFYGQHESRYFFFTNPSLQHWKDDLYVMTFRFIQYTLPMSHFRHEVEEIPFSKHYDENDKRELCHPWKMWDNGYKFLRKEPDQCHCFFPWSSCEKVYMKKYRSSYSADRIIDLSVKIKNQHSCNQIGEVDTTGCTILQYFERENKWQVNWITFTLFGNDMNQDARLYKHPTEIDEFLITYNGYFRTRPPPFSRVNMRTEMLQRRIEIFQSTTSYSYMYMTEEEPLLFQTSQRVEKNCIFLNEDTILYGLQFQTGFLMQHKVNHETSTSSILKTLGKVWKHAFGDDVILPQLSLGSPPLYCPFSGRWIMTFHYKIQYKEECYQSWPWVRKVMQDEQIYRHGKLIYLLGILEFDSKYQVTRVSFPFLPYSDYYSYSPFLLCFSTGLTWNQSHSSFLMSYGEGDVRTRICSFSISCLENLLWTEKEIECCLSRSTFMIPSPLLSSQQMQKQPIVHYIGYFNERNVGDDAFVIMHRYLYRKNMIPTTSLFEHPWFVFQNSPPQLHTSAKIVAIIFAGGDVINPYFLSDKVQSLLQQWSPLVPIHAVSVGIPYIQHSNLLSLFHSMILRNEHDARFLKDSCPIPLYSFPDLVFGIQQAVVVQNSLSLASSSPKIGINICRTYYEKKSHMYPKFISSLAQVFSQCFECETEWKDAQCLWIPFCTPICGKKHHEDDRIIHQQIQEMCSLTVQQRSTDISDLILNDDGNINALLSILKTTDFLICTRFHAHVLAIVTQTPFVSLACSRKCKELLSQYGLSDLAYSFATTTKDKPKPIEHTRQLRDWILQKYNQRHLITARLTTLFVEHLQPQTVLFHRHWSNVLDTLHTKDNHQTDSPCHS